MRKKTTKQFITEAQAMHGNKYDYSKTNYVNAKTKVTISCSEHGLFDQSPRSHIKGQGCPLCANKKRKKKRNRKLGKTTEQYVAEALAVHGNKYDYSQTQYTGSNNKIKIICPKHGVFEQDANTHRRGHGCPTCSRENQFKTQDTIIDEFKKIHSDKYDYSQVIYDGILTKIKIICPVHGIFEVNPSDHKKGHGCQKCYIDRKTKTQNTIIAEFKKVHGDRYDYGRVKYTGAKDNVEIICKAHGAFHQTPSLHKRGCGCPSCSKNKRPSSVDEVINGFKDVHGNKYDYSLVQYANAHSRIKIICPKHGVFEQEAQSHKQGIGCPSCSDYGFNPDKPAIVYYLSINKGEAFKIGITNRKVEDRFACDDWDKIEVVKIWRYRKGRDAYNFEQLILKQYAQYKYNDVPLLSSGNTELFKSDILQLINGVITKNNNV